MFCVFKLLLPGRQIACWKGRDYFNVLTGAQLRSFDPAAFSGTIPIGMWIVNVSAAVKCWISEVLLQTEEFLMFCAQVFLQRMYFINMLLILLDFQWTYIILAGFSCFVLFSSLGSELFSSSSTCPDASVGGAEGMFMHVSGYNTATTLWNNWGNETCNYHCYIQALLIHLLTVDV